MTVGFKKRKRIRGSAVDVIDESVISEDDVRIVSLNDQINEPKELNQKLLTQTDIMSQEAGIPENKEAIDAYDSESKLDTVLLQSSLKKPVIMKLKRPAIRIKEEDS
jgi:hypothetical protein